MRRETPLERRARLVRYRRVYVERYGTAPVELSAETLAWRVVPV